MHTDCLFCRANGLLKDDIIAESDDAYLIENLYFPGNFLVIPSAHTESPLDLPDMWWQEAKKLIAQIPALPESYNLSFNIGEQAGQTIKHLHLWVVPRAAEEPASGKGLATLIKFRNEHKA